MKESETDEIVAIDLFCGAGGFSEGLRQAAVDLGFELRHAAVNHWDTAVETHKQNFPDAHQYQSKVEQLHPPDVVRRLTDGDSVKADLLIAGPKCTHFSRARGGKPVDEQLRMSPWSVLSWLDEADISAFILENVPEIQQWGPVEDGEPTRDGSIFSAWVNALNSLGYAIDWTELVAADYGDPTSRKRFFIVGRKDGSVTWPEPTHSNEDPDLPDYRTAAGIIDWTDLGESIWTRDLTQKRVHSPPKNSTLERIAEGIRRHCADVLNPFADVLETLGRDEIRDLRENRCVPVEYASVAAATLDEPFLIAVPGNHGREESGDSILLKQQDWGHPWSVDDRPVPTITTRGAHALVTPSLIMPKNGSHRGLHSNPLYPAGSRPHHTITTDPRSKLVSPSLIRWSHGGATLDIDDPMPTIATERGGVFALSSPYLCPLYNSRDGQRPRTRSVDRPLMTVPASKPSPAMLSVPFIDDYEGPAKSLDSPLGTVTSRDRFALCVPKLWPWGLDIAYRMLQPSELMQAQGFSPDYELTGTKTERTEQIGNAVPVHLAKALCKHVLSAENPSLANFGGGITDDNDADIPSYSEAIADGGRSNG